MTQTPFPTVFEGIRAIALAFDTKASNKKIDELAEKADADYRQIKWQIDEVILKPLGKYVSPEFAEEVKLKLVYLKNEYLEMVSKTASDGLGRQKIISLMIEYWMKPRVYKIADNIAAGLGVNGFSNSNDKSVKFIFSWLENNIQGWKSYKDSCSKETKDRFSYWVRGESLPSSHSISNMSEHDDFNKISEDLWVKIKSLVFLARSIDCFENNMTEYGLDVTTDYKTFSGDVFYEKLRASCRSTNVHASTLIPYVLYLFENLEPESLKTKDLRHQSRNKLNEYRELLIDINEIHNNEWFINLFESRWHVYSGDIKSACEWYKKTIDCCLYTSGDCLKHILKEAFVIASLRSDKQFIKRLKNISVTFSFDIASVLSADSSNSFDNIVEGWEMKLHRSQVLDVFPETGLFSGITWNVEKPRKGAHEVDCSKLKKPDYTRINKYVSIGENYKKKYPQFLVSIIFNKCDEVKTFIDEDVDVTKLSDASDSALNLSLDQMDITVRGSKIDRSIYNLVKLAPNIENIVNVRTEKLRLLPIIQAVETGDPDVVNDILKMGADPNQRGKTDNQTALVVCLKIIGILKGHERFLSAQRTDPINEKSLDAIRRQTNGELGSTLDEQKNYAYSDECKLDTTLRSKARVRNIVNNMKYSDLFEIFKLLLTNGANPNAEMSSPREGHTPMMLASELDLDAELSLMLWKGGDLDKTFRSLELNINFNSWDLAKIFKAKKVLRLMSDIRANYQRVH